MPTITHVFQTIGAGLILAVAIFAVVKPVTELAKDKAEAKTDRAQRLTVQLVEQKQQFAE